MSSHTLFFGNGVQKHHFSSTVFNIGQCDVFLNHDHTRHFSGGHLTLSELTVNSLIAIDAYYIPHIVFYTASGPVLIYAPMPLYVIYLMNLILYYST